MERLSAIGLDSSGVSIWVPDSANASFEPWDFGYASPDPWLGTPIPNCKRRIKKLLALARDPDVDLWALDEVHFQQHGSRCRMWVPPEVRDPVCRHAPTRKLISYFGAVRIRDGRLVTSKPEGRFDAQTCWSFLRQLRRRSRRRGRRVIVIIDNARYHHATLHAEWRRLQVPGFILLFLPPYSPNLNPI